MATCFAPERHFNVTNSHTQSELAVVEGILLTMFHNKAILDSAAVLLQDVSTCTLVYKKPGKGIGFFLLVFSILYK